VMTHTKECALKPECAASGYSIFAEGKLYKLNADSNAKVAAFLANADSRLDVVVTGDEVDGELNVVEIQNQ